MSARVPEGAFEYYVRLGEERSYQAVADHFHVSKRAIQNVADREHWIQRLEAIEKEAWARIDATLVNDVEQMKLRHSKMLRAIFSRAAKAIQDYPLTSGLDGVRAAELAIKLERLLAGQPSDRTAVSIEDVLKREFGKFMSVDESEEPDGEHAGEPEESRS